MITVSNIDDNASVGYTGNRFFQIANAYSVAKKSNEPLVFPPFELDNTFKNNFFDVIPKSNIKTETIYREPYFHYQEIPILKNCALEGYFQSHKYFDGKEIKKLFQPKEDIKNKILGTKNEQLSQIYDDVLSYNNVCAIHVRRGDFLNFSAHHNNLQF